MNELLINEAKRIYERIGNDYSREMFINRLLYSITGNVKYIRNVILQTEEGRKFISYLELDKKKVIFGAGVWGKEILKTYSDITFECFVDNRIIDDSEDECEGLKVISFKKYIKQYGNDALIIISSRLYHNEIYTQLIEAGIDKDLIVDAGLMIDEMSKRQYFDLKELCGNRVTHECFIDAGSFDGETSLRFVEWMGESDCFSVYAFEPDSKNIQKCRDNLKNLGDKANIVPKGLWDRKGKLRFNQVSNGASNIADDGVYEISVDKLDNMLPPNVQPTFIKMDLEGAEYNAILGAKKVIENHCPKLAISIYHKPDDILRLPKVLNDINEDYVLYFGHYSVAAYETVMYALPR